MHLCLKNMRNSYKTQKISVLLFERFSNHCLANVVEPLRAANDLSGRRYFEWEYITSDGRPVISSAGMPILPDGALRETTGGEYLFVQPSYEFERFTSPQTLRALTAASKRFGAIAGLDTGSWLLAAAGLLDGHKATIHWDHLERFAETFPEVDIVDDRFVIDGERISCGGAMTAFDLVCELIGRSHGEKLRMNVQALFVHSVSRPNQSEGFGGTDIVAQATAIMRSHIETLITIPEIARRMQTNRQRLEREFSVQLGSTPKNVYKNIRLSHAKQLAEGTNFPIGEIAIRCGYMDASAMTRAFVQEFGITPRACRSIRSMPEAARFWADPAKTPNG